MTLLSAHRQAFFRMVAINVLFGAELFLLSMMLSRSYQMRSCNRLPYSFRQIVNDIAHEQSQRSSTAHFSTQKVTRNGLGKPKGYWDVKSRYVLEQQNLSGLPDVSKPFLVLGIESSCDDTGAAIVRSDGVILSNVVYSQYEIHEKFGGIVPSLAMEAHKGNIEKAVSEAIKLAGLESCAEVDVIAVTRGPGLEICLRVGYQKAQVRYFMQHFCNEVKYHNHLILSGVYIIYDLNNHCPIYFYER